MLIDVVINGERLRTEASPGTRLIDLLRSSGLTGTKDSCSLGECGSCTVLIGGRPVLACLTLVARLRAPVRTIEGLATESTTLREAFADHGALQCGYCTPGQVVTGCALLAVADDESSTEISADDLDGNFCRCTGSQPIAAAINACVEDRRGRR